MSVVRRWGGGVMGGPRQRPDPLQTKAVTAFSAAVARSRDPVNSAAGPLDPRQQHLASQMARRLGLSSVLAARERPFAIRQPPAARDAAAQGQQREGQE